MKEAIIFLHGKEKIYSAEDLDLIIKADDFSISGDVNNLRYRLVCSSCSSPAIFVSKQNGQKYFRHPARKTKQLKDKDKDCELRYNSLSTNTIKTHNKIIEQTTFREYSDNFKKIYNYVNKWPDDAYQTYNTNFQNKAIREIFNLIQKDNRKVIDKLISKYPEPFNNGKKRLNLKYEERFQNYYSFHKDFPEEKDKVLEFPAPILIDIVLDPVNILIENLASYLDTYEKNPDLLNFQDETIKKLYPITVKQQVPEFTRLFEMLMHDNSKEIREWLAFTYILCAYARDKKSGIFDHFYDLPAKDIFTTDGLKFFLGEIFFLILNPNIYSDKSKFKARYRKASEKLKEILVSNQLETSLFFPRIICEALRNTSLEQWYEAIDSANRSRELSEKKNSGFIYIAINNDVYRDGKGIDEEVKIGKTKNIEKRKDNYKTYSSDGWLFLDVWHVNNRHRAENFIHNALKKYKVDKGSGKEFFRLSSKEAISRVEDLIEEYQKQNGYLYEETIPSGRGFK